MISRLYICRELEKIESLTKENYNFFDCFCTEILIKTRGLVLMKFQEYKSFVFLLITSLSKLESKIARRDRATGNWIFSGVESR